MKWIIPLTIFLIILQKSGVVNLDGDSHGPNTVEYDAPGDQGT